jgi:F-type H+-transporting ATPase subunit delta
MAEHDRIEGYASALFEIAKAEGTLDEVEDELFRFARTLEANDELRTSLTDEMIPPARRQAVVEDLMGKKASPTTVNLVSFIIGSGRGRDLPAIVNRLVERAAAEKDRAVAEVRTAVPLTEDQQTRLAAALANATGRQIELKVVVDPSVLGGVVAQVGDIVIDGTVRAGLDQLRTLL